MVTEEDAEFYRGYAWRRSKPVISGLDVSVEDQIFEGSKNAIILKREFYHDFKCDFDLLWYPFDRQTCYMNFTVQGQTARSLILRRDQKFIPYYGQKFLVEYTVEGQELIIEPVSGGNFSTAAVQLNFRRRVIYHLLNIFLQSLFLVLTGYMSLFFHVNNFSDRVMVALTVMLVMASLQSSIQDSVPKTAYFKFIDWWILFSLNTQIALMAYHTFLGWFCGNEYTSYREYMIAKLAIDKSNEAKENGGYKVEMVDPPTISSLEEEIISPEEYDYPKGRKLNKFVTIFFCIALLGFNVFYWTVALIVYFS